MKTAFLGEAPKTPEELIQEKSISKGLDLAISGLSAEDQRLAGQIFEVVLSIGHFSDQKHLMELVSSKTKGIISTESMKRVFRKIASNPELLELMA